MHEAGWEAWHEFFLLTGTAGVTLAGLLFVVVSFGSRVVADRTATGVRAFVTPNIYHLTAAFVASAVFLGPPIPPRVMGVAFLVAAIGSFAYLMYTKAHVQWRQNELPLTDWLWFIGAPWAAYFAWFAAGIGYLAGFQWATRTVAVAIVVLLVTGIRNAWDLILWMTQEEKSQRLPGRGEPEPPVPPSRRGRGKGGS